MKCLYTYVYHLDALERDAELGIDRETTDLVSMLEEKGNSSQFYVGICDFSYKL